MEKLITIGNQKVVTTGTFITPDDKISKIMLSRGKEKISIEIQFLDSMPASKLDIKSGGTKESITIRFIFSKMQDPEGEGLPDPINFAHFDNGDALYLSLWLRRLTNKNIKVIYTVYMEEK